MRLPTTGLVVLGAALLALGSGAMCKEHTGSTLSGAQGLRAPTIGSERTESVATRLPAAFSVSRVDWPEAQRVLGYAIIKSATFPLTWPYLFVQPAIESGGSIPRKAVALYSIDGVGVRVTVAPEITWKVGALRRGEPLVIEGRQGWLLHRGSDLDYAYACGRSEPFGEVWCQVEMNSSSTDLLTRFVTDLVP